MSKGTWDKGSRLLHRMTDIYAKGREGRGLKPPFRDIVICGYFSYKIVPIWTDFRTQKKRDDFYFLKRSKMSIGHINKNYFKVSSIYPPTFHLSSILKVGSSHYCQNTIIIFSVIQFNLSRIFYQTSCKPFLLQPI